MHSHFGLQEQNLLAGPLIVRETSAIKSGIESEWGKLVNWFNEKLLKTQQQYRLSYNALTRQYRLGVGSLFHNFSALPEALDFLSRVRRRQVLEPGMLDKGNTYIAGVRMRPSTAFASIETVPPRNSMPIIKVANNLLLFI